MQYTRREEDSDPSKKILAETAKLTGNVVYGTTRTDKENFCDTKYTCSKHEVTNLVNNTRFRSIEELDDDVFEVQLVKSIINLNTSIVLGFTMFQTAKLKMLLFYFDFMMYYFHDDKFAYVAMDTDCAYFATSKSLEKEIISTKLFRV